MVTVGARLVLVLALVLQLPAGCGGDGPREVVFSPGAPERLAVRGTVFGSTLSGTRGEPEPGVRVHLSGAASASALETDEAGEFEFGDLAPGTYRVVAEKAGFQTAQSAEADLRPWLADLPDGTTATVYIDLRSNPVIASVTPAPGSVVAQHDVAPSIRFNEPIDPTSARTMLLFLGSRDGQATAAREIATAATWSEAGATIAVSPLGPVPASGTFELVLEGDPNVLDHAGFPLDLTGSGGGLTATRFRFHTAAGGVPGEPGNAALALEGDPPPTTDWAALASAPGGPEGVRLKLTWAPPSAGPSPSGYRIHAACGESPVFVAARLGETTAWTTRLGELGTLLFGPADALDPVGLGNVPLVSCTLVLRVAAENRDGVGPAAEATLEDDVPPALLWAGRASPGGELLPIEEPGSLYLGFSEPVTWSGTVAQVFGVLADGAGVAVSAAELAYETGRAPIGDARLYAVVRLSHGPLPDAAPVTVLIRGGLEDLAGNVLSTGAERASFGPFTP